MHMYEHTCANAQIDELWNFKKSRSFKILIKLLLSHSDVNFSQKVTHILSLG